MILIFLFIILLLFIVEKSFFITRLSKLNLTNCFVNKVGRHAHLGRRHPPYPEGTSKDPSRSFVEGAGTSHQGHGGLGGIESLQVEVLQIQQIVTLHMMSGVLSLQMMQLLHKLIPPIVPMMSGMIR